MGFFDIIKGLTNGSTNTLTGQPKTTTPTQPVVASSVQTAPTIAPITPVVKQPVVGPITVTQNNPTTTTKVEPFKLDTSNISTDHLGTDNTPTNVLSSIYQNYQNNAPTADQYAQATQFSPGYLDAYNQTLNTNQGYRAGVQNIRGRPEALDFQQGQESALTRDTALTQQANAENMALQEAIRQNNIASVQAKQTGAQNQFANQLATTQSGLNYGISKAGLDIQQQQATQNRYEYQQITDPSTGFPTIQILDKQSGLPVGNVSPGSSMGQNIVNSGLLNQGTQNNQTNNNGIVNGYNITSYATDPNHEQAVTGWYNAINNSLSQSGINGITDANTAQAVINQLAPNSPVTGQMIINSATKYGVDPALMVSLMQQDSQMGTKGLATKTFNPGNVGNDGTNIKNMGSWDKGVDSVAKWLSTHKEDTQSTMGPTYQNIVASAPAQLQSAIKPLPDGSAYINSSLLANPQFGVMAQNFASQNGIRVLNSSDATALDTVNQSVKNMQTLANTFGNLASKTAVGGKLSNITDPLSQFFDTNFGSQLMAFNKNRDGLFQSVRALAGSSPRLNGTELNIAADSMPTLNELNKDTLKDGINKLVKTQSYLDNAIKTFVPNYIGTPVTINNQYAVLGNDGKAYTFPDNNSALLFLKAQQ